MDLNTGVRRQFVIPALFNSKTGDYVLPPVLHIVPGFIKIWIFPCYVNC